MPGTRPFGGISLLFGLVLALFGVASMAADITFSGFASFTEGKVLSGNGQNSDLGQTYKCPCFLANYEYAGVYQNNAYTAAPESVVGLQTNVQIDPQLSATIQVDGRSVDGFKGSVDWAYLSYLADSNWTIQAGHKRIPMYYYADSNYIGYSYIWVRPPVDLYGWDVYAYDGVNALYKKTFGDWSLVSNVWAGNQDSKNNVYWQQLYNQGVPTESNWSNILGTYVDISNDIYDLRLIYMQNGIAVTSFTSPGVPVSQGMDGTPFRQQVVGAAFTADFENWILRTEINNVKRTAPWAAPNAPAGLLGLGYRIGEVTGMLTYSRYWETTSATYTLPQRDDTRTATLRWDFHKGVALKFQLDMIKDHSPNGNGGTGAYFGDGNLFTVSLVTVF